MPDNPGHTPGTHWAMRVDFSESVSGPSIKPGLGAAVGILEIRNLDSGEIGTYGMASLDVGFGIGLGASLGNGEWSVFETAHPETLHSFEGHIRTPSTQVGRWSVESRIVLPVEIKHDSWLGAVWNQNSVDVSGTSSSLGLGMSDGEGVLHLEHVTQGVIDEVGAYAVEHAVQMPSDQGPEAGAGGHSAAYEDAAAPGFNMEQDAAAPGFNMEQDAAAPGFNMEQDAAAPGFNMEQDAAAPGFNMEQDAATYGSVGLSDDASPVIDASGGYTDVGLADQYSLGGADTSAIDSYAAVGLADHGDSAFDGNVQFDVMHGSGDQGLGDATYQSGQLNLDDTPDPGQMA